MENIDGIKNIDLNLSQLSDLELSQLYLHANSFYGDVRKYNISEYIELYQKIVDERRKRANDKLGKK